MNFNIPEPALDPNLIYGLIGLFGTLGIMGYALYKTIQTKNFPGKWTLVFISAQLFIFVLLAVNIAPAINARTELIQDVVQEQVEAVYGIELSEKEAAELVGSEVSRRLGGDDPEETTWTSPHLATIPYQGREAIILLTWQEGHWKLMEQVDTEMVEFRPSQR